MNKWFHVSMFLIGGLLSAFVLARISEHQFRKLRIQAVERGYAEWITATDGTSTWKWKDNQPTKP